MRPVRNRDVSLAAAALLAAEPGLRRGLVERLLLAADKADALGCDHLTPAGAVTDGTLGGAALRHRRADRPQAGDRDYCDCLLMVFEALLNQRIRSACN